MIGPGRSRRVPGSLFLLALAVSLGPQARAASPPSTPGRVSGSLSAAGLSFTLAWSTPTSRVDGSSLALADIREYRIIRRLGLTGATNQLFLQSPSTANVFTDNTVSGGLYYYRVRATDQSGQDSPDSDIFASDASNSVIILADDQLSHIKIPGADLESLAARGLSLRGTRETSEETSRVLKSVNFRVEDAFTGESVKGFVADRPVELSIGYSVDGDGRVSHGAPAGASDRPLSSAARQALSLYWHNGSDWIKVGSTVNEEQRVARITARLAGRFQLRLVDQPLEAQLNAVYPRTVTPNGDGVNDLVFFLFENPTGAPASGTIYDLRSAKVADVQNRDIFGGDTVLAWDGRDGSGNPVAGGLYLYKISVGDRSFTGSIAVAR